MCYKRCHFAVQSVRQLKTTVLFPKDKIQFEKPLIRNEHLNWIDLNLNERQKRAVINILKGECRPHPYIVFGPPGTGKTRTIVEAILQIAANIRGSRIIACAPSNACADQLAVALVNSNRFEQHEIVRLLAFSRFDRFPDELDPYVVESSQNPHLSVRRVVVTTCGSVGALLEYSHRPGFFTHCFIDEATQATEPEALQVLSLVSPSDGVSVLIGDPYQLGPICQSSDAKDYGLGKPLLNRLFLLKPYKRSDDKYRQHGFYDPRCITKLIESYRCHEHLISVNSQLFYDGELICWPSRDEELLAKLEHEYPVIFEGVRGQDMREINSCSWFNAAEVLKTVQYLRELYDAGVTTAEIGVITPYRKQMERIREFIDIIGLDKPKIATVEEFQGGERRVIIVSLVRTDPRNLDVDIKKQLGFVFNQQRFNVATTRAKSLLIVIGDPFCMVRDECWKAFIVNCMLNKSYFGVEFTLDDVHAERYDPAIDDEEEKWPNGP